VADKLETRELGKASHGGNGHRGGALWVRGFGRAMAYLARNARTGKRSPRVTEIKKGILGLSPSIVGKAYQFPLCDLCAMLSLVRAFLAHQPTVSSVRPHVSPSIVGKAYQFPPL
jgi:hypothetical protein